MYIRNNLGPNLHLYAFVGTIKAMATKAPKQKPASDSPGSALVQMRWNKTTPAERKEIGRTLANTRWGGKTEEERKAIGKQLAEARKKAKKEKSKTGKTD